MTTSLEITMDALDAEPVAAWWADVLGFERLYERDPYIVIAPPAGDPRPRLVIQQVGTVTLGKAPVHLDLRVDDPDAEVARLAALGASIEWTVDETAEGFITWTTMADPWGTVFCVCPAREPRGDEAAP
ncbi:MAG TPA: VOC family protein [Actinomycetota bacterium]